ncbi:Uncharacterised protein [Acinetobacter baumannii]|nr:Uncharacterised protein [Acinetobacter baumannii]
MVELFGLILLWGIPALLLWSVVLSIIHIAKEPISGQFLGRTLTFIGAIGFTEDAIFGPIMFILFGAFMVYNFFPRYNMPE